MPRLALGAGVTREPGGLFGAAQALGGGAGEVALELLAPCGADGSVP